MDGNNIDFPQVRAVYDDQTFDVITVLWVLDGTTYTPKGLSVIEGTPETVADFISPKGGNMGKVDEFVEMEVNYGTFGHHTEEQKNAYFAKYENAKG